MNGLVAGRFFARLSRHIMFIGALFICMVFLHELGHALAAKLTGHDNIRFYVWPGVELYPEFNHRYDQQWPARSIAMTTMKITEFPSIFPSFQTQRFMDQLIAPAMLRGDRLRPVPRFTNLVQIPNVTPWQVYSTTMRHDLLATRRREQITYDIISLMGSGFTLLLSVAATSALLWLQATGVLLHGLRVLALLHFDILTYAIFPWLFDAPHLLFFGGTNAEPIIALAGLGVPAGLSAVVISSTSLMLLLLYFVARKKGRAV